MPSAGQLRCRKNLIRPLSTTQCSHPQPGQVYAVVTNSLSLLSGTPGCVTSLAHQSYHSASVSGMVLEYVSGIPRRFKRHIMKTLSEVLPICVVSTSCVLPPLYTGSGTDRAAAGHHGDTSDIQGQCPQAPRWRAVAGPNPVLGCKCGVSVSMVTCSCSVSLAPVCTVPWPIPLAHRKLTFRS